MVPCSVTSLVHQNLMHQGYRLCVLCAPSCWLSHVCLQFNYLQWPFYLLQEGFGSCTLKGTIGGLLGLVVGSDQISTFSLFARTVVTSNCKTLFPHCSLFGVGSAVRPDRHLSVVVPRLSFGTTVTPTIGLSLCPAS